MSIDQYDIIGMVQQAGYTMRGATNKWSICPIPTHIHSSRPSPSFSVYFTKSGRQRFKCHGNCGARGDAVDFAGYMWIAGYNPQDQEMRREAHSILTGGRYTISPPTPPPPIKPLPQWLWQEMLPPNKQTVEYAYRRGISDEVLVKHRIGTPPQFMKGEPWNIKRPEKWMALPLFHGKELMGVKLRNTTSFGIRYMQLPGSQKGLYGWNDVYLTTEPVLLVKGEIAKLVCESHGFLACSLTSGEASHMESLVVPLAMAKVVVVGDNDRVEKTRKEMTEKTHMRAAILGGIARFPPKKYKDIDEYLLADTQDAVRTIRKWLEEV